MIVFLTFFKSTFFFCAIMMSIPYTQDTLRHNLLLDQRQSKQIVEQMIQSDINLMLLENQG